MEKNLEEAADKLGLSIKDAPAEEKAVLSSLYDSIKEMVAKQKAENGEEVASSALFAAAIIGHSKINDPKVREAATNYIDQDLAYCRFRATQIEQLEKKLEEAADKLGLSIKDAPAEEKAVLSSLYDSIKEMVAKQKAENGEEVASSALFAAAIIGHSKINDPKVREAAVSYIDQDLAYCRFRAAQK